MLIKLINRCKTDMVFNFSHFDLRLKLIAFILLFFSSIYYSFANTRPVLLLEPFQNNSNSKDSLPLPIIDVHLHSPGKAGLPATLEMMRKLNVKYAVFIGTSNQLSENSENAGKFLNSLTFPCEGGKMPNIGLQCFDDGGTFPNLKGLRDDIRNGKVKVLGEVNAQYMTISPNDTSLNAFYHLAEEMDVPFGIHLGVGPPGASYNMNGFPPNKSPNYRGFAGNPMLLEDVLVNHPKLRLYVMHAAYPFLQEMLYMLYMHPQLYVDVSVLQWAIPRLAYYNYLRSLVEGGFGKRIMFGSDGGPTRLQEGVQAILNADFLTTEQKRDILFNNAAKFFRLND